MKVRELIEKLHELDPELSVWTSRDEEGNGYNRVHFDPEVRYVHEDEIDDYEVDSLRTLEDLHEEIEDGSIEEEDIDSYVRVALI